MNNYILFLLMVLFASCNKALEPVNVKSQSLKIEEGMEVKPDAEIETMITPYKKQLDKEMNKVIGESAITMRKAKPQSTLGNWIADLTYQKSKEYYGKPIDFAIVNYGGVRISTLPKGPVTIGKIYELMPFDNMLVVMKIKGTIVKQLLDRIAEEGGWPISQQIQFQINNNQAQEIKINDEVLVLDQMYKVAMADFIANGGGECFFLKDQPRDKLGLAARDAILEFVKEETASGKLLDAEMDFRTKVINQ